MKFRQREVVRVAAAAPVAGQLPEGAEGVVDSFCERPKGVFVRFDVDPPNGQSLWFFTEDELEETGWIEVDAATHERVPFHRGGDADSCTHDTADEQELSHPAEGVH